MHLYGCVHRVCVFGHCAVKALIYGFILVDLSAPPMEHMLTFVKSFLNSDLNCQCLSGVAKGMHMYSRAYPRFVKKN